MEVWVEDTTFQYWGDGETYFVNRSGDTLSQLFYHLYFNAFQPGSAMHQRAIAIHSWLAERISRLTPAEYGKLELFDVSVNGKAAVVQRFGTIARVSCPNPILPGDTVRVQFRFRGQIPKLVRRAGRDNAQGVRFSMAQWYPKLCQYDRHGWHNNQYVGREFYGIWGTYDVVLHLPAKYTVGASGVLQNPAEVGHGYQFAKDTVIWHPQPAQRRAMLRWHFIASPVHDFAWVADDAYVHQIARMDSVWIHILCKRQVYPRWKPVAQWIRKTMRFFSQHYTPYPYRTFTCAQAGDGGMEYPQLIMITHRSRRSLLGVIVHEIGHQWFYGLVANNETKHAWMDEGFTTFITAKALRQVFQREWEVTPSGIAAILVPEIPEGIALNMPHWRVVESGFEEPLTTPHDRFRDWFTARQVYSKGAAMLRQLEYSFGEQAVDSLLRYYVQKWRFRHPYPADFEKACETVFQQRLDAFFDTFIREVTVPDYGFQSIEDSVDAQGWWHTRIRIGKANRAHVPLNLLVYTADGHRYRFHIPMDVPYRDQPHWLSPWFWTNATYVARIITDARVVAATFDTTGKLIDRYAGNNWIRNRWWFPTIAPVRVGLYENFWRAQPLRYYGISLRPTLWYFGDGAWQLGVRADGLIDFDRYRATLGVYYTLKPPRWDWQVRFSHPVRWLLPQGRLFVAAAVMDRVELAQCQLFGVVPQQHYADPLHIRYGGGIEYWHWQGSDRIRPGVVAPDQWFYRAFVALHLAAPSGQVLAELSGGLTRQLPPLPRWQPGGRLTVVGRWTLPRSRWLVPEVTAAGSVSFGFLNPYDRLHPARGSAILRFRTPMYRFFSFLESNTALSPFLPSMLSLSPNLPAADVLHFAGLSSRLNGFAPLRQLGRVAPMLLALTAEPYATVVWWSIAANPIGARWTMGAEIGIDLRLQLDRLLPLLPFVLPPEVGALEMRWRIGVLQFQNGKMVLHNPFATPAIGIGRWSLSLASLWRF